MNRNLKVAVVLMLLAPSAFAATITINDKIKLNLGITAQMQLAIFEHGAADTTIYPSTAPSVSPTQIEATRYYNRGVGWDFGVRRLRFNFGGEFYKKVAFYFQLEAGSNLALGNATSRGFLGTSATPGSASVNPVYVQDIFVTYSPFRELIIDAGLMMPGITHLTYKSSASYTSVETHGFFTKFPTTGGGATGILQQGGSRGFRDLGVQIRGTAVGNYLQYRLGVYAGNHSVNTQSQTNSQIYTVNPQGYPRLTGNLRFNLWDAEEGFFSNGVYFGKKKLLSVSFGVDYQQNGALDTSRAGGGKAGVNTDALTLGGDLIFDYPFGRDNQHEVILQVNVANYNQGAGRDSTGALVKTNPDTGAFQANPNSGTALVIEAGYRWRKLLPAFTYQRFFSVSNRNEYEAFRGTIGWLVDGWRVKFQLELAGVRDNLVGAKYQSYPVLDSAGKPSVDSTGNPISKNEFNPATTPYQFQARLQAHFNF